MVVKELRKALDNMDDEKEVVVMVNIDEGCMENQVVSCDSSSVFGEEKTTGKLEIYINLYGLTIDDIERGQNVY